MKNEDTFCVITLSRDEHAALADLLAEELSYKNEVDGERLSRMAQLDDILDKIVHHGGHTLD